ncbi:DsbA family oxidoreductase [Salinispora fenicalii]|uniref:DsbA family oxidoreductase n=1 Tax=Salinispora fenicalii TaxID=1137263 RepID=UPI0009E7E46B|nr:DsbA family protein [Salinispora fenicalii]
MNSRGGKMLKIDMIMDVSCIWSYLTFTRLQHVLGRHRAAGTPVRIAFHPFQVHPDAGTQGEPLSQVLYRAFGPRAVEPDPQFDGMLAAEGIHADVESALHVNTFDAHLLLAEAGELGKGEEMAERLFRAYYQDGLNIADREVLDALAAELGMTFDGSGGAELRRRLAEVRAQGYEGVPVVTVAGSVPLRGAQSRAQLDEVIRESAEVAGSR